MAKQATRTKHAAAARKAAPKASGKPSKGRDGDTAEAVKTAVASLIGAISGDKLDQLPPELVQKLLAAAIRTYSAKVQAGEKFLPFHPQAGRVSPTDVMITASALLKAADLQVFELGMWQSYTGR
jgi:hypothetical protein